MKIEMVELETLEDCGQSNMRRRTLFGYPIGSLIIAWNGFCDRFVYFGVKAILILYLADRLKYTDDDSTVIYHLFYFLALALPLLGAIIGDSSFGKFKTILVFTVVYFLGSLLLTLAAAAPLNLPTTEMSLVALVLLGMGTGFTKPCLVAMGGDQYRLPEEEAELGSFFALFYFAISVGSLLSTFLEPIFRKDVSCFDGDCYFLAYLSNTVVLLLALVSFVAGMTLYRSTGSTSQEYEGGWRKGRESSIITVFQCIWHALKRRWITGEKSEDETRAIVRKKTKRRQSRHWLSYASDKFDEEQIRDIKAVVKVLVFYIPFPMFWSLLEQQGSRWVLQASRMNGELFGYTIKADQVQVINPLLVLTLIPVLNKVVYPLLGRCNLLTKPLHRIVTGGFLAAVSYAISGFVELKLESMAADVDVTPGNVTNSLHMLWLLPQYSILALGEIMFVVTGMEFTYAKAPVTMKSTLQSIWFLTIAGGNLIVAIITEANLFADQSSEFFFDALLMFIDILLLIWIVQKSYAKELNTNNADRKVSHSFSGDEADDDDSDVNETGVGTRVENEEEESLLESGRQRERNMKVKGVALFLAEKTN